jgi:glycosyltransferase involved in cell wall biosynthesis
MTNYNQMFTIGIPTYNREKAVVPRIRHLLSQSALLEVRILMVIDGSRDGTTHALNAMAQEDRRLIVVARETNRGYCATYAELFERCPTPYLMVTTDDDDLMHDNVPSLLHFLKTQNPSFVSTIFLLDGKQYRGRIKTHPIEARQVFDCASHAPGLVYHVNDCSTAIQLLREQEALGSEAARIYPQVLVISELLANRDGAHWLSVPLVSNGAALPSGIIGSSGGTYWGVESRWRQLLDFEKFWCGRAEVATTARARKRYEEMIRVNRRRCFGLMRYAMSVEWPDAMADYDYTSRRYALRSLIRDAIGWPRKAESEDRPK